MLVFAIVTVTLTWGDRYTGLSWQIFYHKPFHCCIAHVSHMPGKKRTMLKNGSHKATRLSISFIDSVFTVANRLCLLILKPTRLMLPKARQVKIGMRFSTCYYQSTVFNSLAPGRCGSNFRLISRIDSLALPVKFVSSECPTTPSITMTS